MTQVIIRKLIYISCLPNWVLVLVVNHITKTQVYFFRIRILRRHTQHIKKFSNAEHVTLTMAHKSSTNYYAYLIEFQ